MSFQNNEGGDQLYNSRIIDTYIKLIRRKYSYVNVSELLSFAGMQPYEVADQGHWFTQDQIDRFYAKLVQMTGNENIAREAGRYAASPEALGVMRQYVLGMVGPAKAYEMLGKAAAHFSRSAEYRPRRIALNKVEFTVIPRPGTREKPFQCENRAGFIDAVSLLFNSKLPKIEHPECMFRGGRACRYVISWERTRSYFLKRARNYTLAVLTLGCAAYGFVDPLRMLEAALPASVFLLGAMTLIDIILEKRELAASLSNLVDSTEQLVDQMNINYNNALMTNEIGQVISKQTDLDSILESVIRILGNRLDYDRGLIMLADREKTHLVFRGGFGYPEEVLTLIRKTAFHLDRPESKGIFVVTFRERKPFLINNIDAIEETLSARSLAFARKLGAQSFITCPIVCENESIGILAVDNVRSKRPLVNSDMSLLMGVANVIAITIRNAELLAARERQMKSILQVLAASIDARDFLTAGHSEKVTEYAVGICSELGLQREYTEMIRVAALLHDYGKIGVPDAILKKEGRLTEDEYEIVKTHCGKTREILEQINFEGIMHQVPEIAASHHEKLDGSGYPRGLKGKDIPLGAKIIAVADYFEAITSKRHYREPMPLEEAFRLLREGCGVHFERRIVEALITFYERCQSDGSPDGGPSSRPPGLRRDRRVPCQVPVALRVHGDVGFGTSADLSFSGIYIATEKEVEEGSPVEVSFVLPGGRSRLVNVLGRVAWINSHRQRRKATLPVGFGVEFKEMQEPVAEVVKSFVGASQAIH